MKELLLELMKITKQIKQLYLKLYILDISKGVDDSNYKNVICMLKSKLEDENRKYEQITSIDDLNELENICLDCPKDDISERILNKLKYLKFSLLLDNKFDSSSELYDISVQLLCDSMFSDHKLGLLCFLDEYIKSPKYASIRGQLLASKYFLPFNDFDIESYLLNHNFSLPDKIYSCVGIKQYILNLSSINLNLIKSYLFSDLAASKLMELIEISNKKLGFYDQLLESITDECIIKSAFIFMNDLSIKNLNKRYQRFLFAKEKSNTENKKTYYESIADNLFVNSDKFKEKAIVLSLKKNI